MIQSSKGYRNRWIALAFMGISLLIISLDNIVLNRALLTIVQDLGSSACQLQWIVDAGGLYYMVITAIITFIILPAQVRKYKEPLKEAKIIAQKEESGGSTKW